MSDQIYHIELNHPQKGSKVIKVSQKISIGSDESKCQATTNSLAPVHIQFMESEGVLVVKQRGPDDSTQLGQTPLKEGKLYIVDAGDVLVAGDIKITIKKQSINEQTIKEAQELASDPSTMSEYSYEQASEVDLDLQLFSNKNDEQKKHDQARSVSQQLFDHNQTLSKVLGDQQVPLEESEKKSILGFINHLFKKGTQKNHKNESLNDELEEIDETEIHLDDEQTIMTQIETAKPQLKSNQQEDTILKVLSAPKKHQLQEVEDSEELSKASTRQSVLSFLNKRKTSSKKKARTPKVPIVPFYLRFFAYFISLGISFALIHNFDFFYDLKQHTFFGNPQSYVVMNTLPFGKELFEYLPLDLLGLSAAKIEKMAKPVFQIWNNDLPQEAKIIFLTLLPLMFLVTIQDILFSFILGANLPLFFLGAKTTKGFLFDRVFGILRAILGVFHPLLIFDLPLLIKKPSLKELLTFSTLRSRQGKSMRFLVVVFIFPCLLLLPALSPILIHFDFFMLEKTVNAAIKPIGRSNLQINPNALLGSQALNLSLPYTAELLIYPQFYIIDQKLQPRFFISSSKHTISLFKRGQLEAQKLYDNSMKANPLGPSFFGPFNSTDTNQLKLLLTSPFQMKLGMELLDYFLSFGPFIQSAFSIRNQLKSFFNDQDPIGVQFDEKANLAFFHFQGQKLSIIKMAPILEFYEIEYSGRNEILANNIMTHYLPYAKWSSKIESQNDPALKLADQVVKVFQGGDQDLIEFEKIKEFYSQLALKALETNLQEYYKKSIQSLINVAKDKKILKTLEIQELENYSKAVSEGQKDYFTNVINKSSLKKH